MPGCAMPPGFFAFLSKTFFPVMQLGALSCRDLVRKGEKEQLLLSFMARKGVRTYEAIFFSNYIENQFDYLCKRAMGR